MVRKVACGINLFNIQAIIFFLNKNKINLRNPFILLEVLKCPSFLLNKFILNEHSIMILIALRISFLLKKEKVLGGRHL
jgi:hypothetical protein